MQVYLIAHAEDIPADLFAVVHDEPRQVAEDVAVNAVHKAPFFPISLIEDHKHGDEFTIHILRAAIRVGHPLPRNYYWTQKTGVDVICCIHMGVVPPDYGIGIRGTGSTLLICQPGIGEAAARRHRRPGTSRVVMSPLIVFIVPYTVGMNAEFSTGPVKKVHDNGITYLCTDYRAQYAQPLRLWFAVLECVICILNISELLPLGIAIIGFRNWASMHEVLACGGIIPHDLFSRNIILANPPLCYRIRIACCH